MEGKRELQWHENYNKLKDYILRRHHLPNKAVVEDRGLLNWWKYNKKMIKKGTLSEEKIAMLQELSDMRSKEHTGGRRKKVVAEDMSLFDE